MRKTLVLAAVLAAVLLGAGSALAGGRYVNPFSDPSWQPSRTDMGMDWVPTRKLPVRAIGDAVILGAENHASWPGHHVIWYRLLNGSHAGDVVYVAEHLKHLARLGQVVHAGQQIALALPGYPWTEWGWANPDGSPRAMPCYKEGKATNSGREMARFLVSLGAAPSNPLGRGASAPSGRKC